MEITTQLINQLFKRKLVWITSPRIKTMEFFLKNSEKMISQGDIMMAMEKKNLSRITIYRTLIYFCEIGLIYKISDARSKPFYSLEANIYPGGEPVTTKFSEHYHFNCIQCGSFSRLPESSSNTELPSGHIKTATNLLVLGYCADCSKGKKIKKVHTN